jgi:acyl-CoA thioester hydrolase
MSHRYDCRIRWSDVDAYGHVNNVKFYEYLQEARIAFLMQVNDAGPAGRRGYVVARLDVDYRRPLVFRPEPIAVESWVTRVGRSSYDLRSRVVDGSETFADAHTVMVAFDSLAQQSRPLDNDERVALERELEDGSGQR